LKLKKTKGIDKRLDCPPYCANPSASSQKPTRYQFWTREKRGPANLGEGGGAGLRVRELAAAAPATGWAEWAVAHPKIPGKIDAIGPATHLPRLPCGTEPSRRAAIELAARVSRPAPAAARSPVCSCLSRGRERLLGSSSASPCSCSAAPASALRSLAARGATAPAAGTAASWSQAGAREGAEGPRSNFLKSKVFHILVFSESQLLIALLVKINQFCINLMNLYCKLI
jgi:hypothetical protein